MKLENEIKDDEIDLEKLVDATIHLRQITANNVLRLWKSQINHITCGLLCKILLL
jgi:hypothetical protein